MLCDFTLEGVLATAITRPSSPESVASSDIGEVPEESSLWDKLELYEPPTPSDRKPVQIVFEEGAIAPKYSPRKAISPKLKGIPI